MSNNFFKYAAFLVGGVALLGGSFFLFAGLSGMPMSEMKGVGGAFPDLVEEPAVASRDLPHHQDELDGDRRSVTQVLSESTSPLRAFLLPSGFSTEKLAELEHDLELRMDELAMRNRALDKRERELDLDYETYQELFAQLEALRADLIEQQAEQEARGEELDAGQASLQASKRASFGKLAPLYAEGRAQAKAGLLLQYTPEEAGMILAALPAERVAELVDAIFKQAESRARPILDAYQEMTSSSPGAK